jgi:4-amino-4-deoxy-L-arabinose transferase-like glycosyltransferase
VAWFLLPFVYTVAYLWLRADAAIAWGHTNHVRGLIDHLGGAPYRKALHLSPRTVIDALPVTVREALDQLPLPAWLLLIPGAFSVGRTRTSLALVLFVWSGLLAVFISVYRVNGREDYLQGITMVLALVVGWGSVEAWDWVAARLDRSARTGLGAVVAGLIAVWAVWVGHDVSLRGDTSLLEEARARLVDVPEFALIYTERDDETFPLWYVTTVLHERSDVTIVDLRQGAPNVGPRR